MSLQNYHQLYLESIQPYVHDITVWKQLPTVSLKENLTEPRNVLKSNTWIWSDIHFLHKNIIKYCNRPYPTYELMNECLIGNYNNVVKPEDICIWVGDIGFGTDDSINEKLNRCNGYKILIVGNHDFYKNNLRRLDFDEVHLLYYLSVEDEDLELVMTHYPMNNLPPDVINVHGHLHDRITNNRNQINVSVERTNYKPKNLKDIIADGKERIKIYKE